MDWLQISYCEFFLQFYLLLPVLHPDFIEYDDAAEEFHPFVKFYATFDPKVRTSISKESSRANICSIKM